jgi:hypothetical protein
MKVSDFKLLSTLPEEYDYDLFTINNEQTVIGKQHQTIIGFIIRNNKLVPINFTSESNKR